MMNRIFAVFFAVFLPMLTIAQQAEQADPRTEKQKKLRPRKKYKLANNLYEKGSYFNALTYYQEVYEKKQNKVQALERAAYINYILRDYKKSEENYKQLLDHEKGLKKYPNTRYMYALQLKYNGKYEESKTAFEAFKAEYEESDAAALKKLADKHIEGCNLAKDLLAKPDKVKIEHLGREVNNPYTDFSPRMVGNPDEIVFGSIRSDTVLNLTNIGEEVDYKSKLYSAKYVGGKWTTTKLPAPINTAEFHTGNGVYSEDKLRFYYTNCSESDNLQMVCAIYVSNFEGGKWGEPVKLGNSINSENATSTQPALAKNAEGKEVLYFVSDRKGGQGGLDIWYAVSTGKNAFGGATNLGSTINTSQDEITPFYHEGSKSLYFSSNGHANVGGFDIFVSEGKEKDWKTPVNIGFPINSSVDDIYYSLHTDKKTGYFVSNRAGGFNLKSETCCDDIYKATLIRDVYIKGYVAAKNAPETPIKGANVSFFDKNRYDATLTAVANFTTGEDPYFVIAADPEKTYQVNSTKAGYWGGEEIFEARKEKVVNDTIYKVFFVEEIAKRKLVLKRIYYEFDKYNLRREDKVSLDSVALVLKDNPTWTIEIFGHTDGKGTEDYNMRLGKDRAQSAADYLVSKHKVELNRMSLISKGKSEPRLPNENPDGSDNPLGRANNRRVEFKVTSNDQTYEVDIEYSNNERKDTK
jgi:outer membrane protein OmpA-like peptidoglycan-associated protein